MGALRFALRRRLNQVLVFFNTGFDFVIGNELITDHCPVPGACKIKKAGCFTTRFLSEYKYFTVIHSQA